jgi:hypothetical protein
VPSYCQHEPFSLVSERPYETLRFFYSKAGIRWKNVRSPPNIEANQPATDQVNLPEHHHTLIKRELKKNKSTTKETKKKKKKKPQGKNERARLSQRPLPPRRGIVSIKPPQPSTQ